MKEDYFTVNELAEEFRVNPEIISCLAEKGGITGCRADGEWRFPKNEAFKALYRDVDPRFKRKKK